jgi:hypothetical protein
MKSRVRNLGTANLKMNLAATFLHSTIFSITKTGAKETTNA